MYNRLSKIFKDIKGNVLAIGLDDVLLDKLKNNNEINLYSITSPKTSKGISKSTKKKVNNIDKPINIKKLKKYMNKKSVDFLILNIEDVFNYYKYIIRQTIFLGNNYIYVYATNEIDKEFIIDKYKRYNVQIEVTDYKDGFILTINAKDGKNNFIKDKLFFIKDSLYNLAESIGNILAS